MGETTTASTGGPVVYDTIVADSGKGKGAQQKKRLLALHEVRTPVGAFDLCNVCKAPVPYVGCCAECAGLRLDLLVAEFWDRLARSVVPPHSYRLMTGGSEDVRQYDL